MKTSKRITYLITGAFVFFGWSISDAIACELHAKVVDVIPMVDEDSDGRTPELTSGPVIASANVPRMGNCTAALDSSQICQLPSGQEVGP